MTQDSQRPAGRRVVPSLPDIMSIGGGAGQNVPAWSRPELLISAPDGVIALTPAHAVMSAGTTASFAAQQDINFLSARNTSVVIQNGLSIFTYGKANSPDKPNQETGLQLHAASGSVSVQAQQNTLALTADKAINVASTTAAITMGAPKHVLLNAGGSSLRIATGGITITTNGPAQFKAAMKELTGAGSASASLDLPKAGELKGCAMKLGAATQSGTAGVAR